MFCYAEKVLTGIQQKINWIDGLRSSKLRMPNFYLGTDEPCYAFSWDRCKTNTLYFDVLV